MLLFKYSFEERDPISLTILHMPFTVTFGFFDQGYF